MIRILSWPLFIVLLVLAGLFIVDSSASLPARVASHFNAQGVADGFSSRENYTNFILCLALGLPAGVVVLLQLIYRFVPAPLINIPHRNYWLAPERRAESVDYLALHAIWLGILLLVFLCWLHWTTLGANAVTPPQMSNHAMYGGLGVFMLAMCGWAGMLFLHFKAPPKVETLATGSRIAKPQRPSRPR